MKIKLDENVTVAALDLFASFDHQAHSVHDEAMTGAPDLELLDVCRREDRLLVTFDLGFGDLRAHPPGTHRGVVLLRLPDQQPDAVLAVLRRLLKSHDLDQLTRCLVVVTNERVRIRRPRLPESEIPRQ